MTSAGLKRVLEQGAPAFFADAGLRLSLAGAQDKLPVIAEGQKLFLPEGSSASTHILKLPSRRWGKLPENQLVMLSLARLVGLPTVTASLYRLPPRAT
ncbi:MAG: HipA domain-containing protein [Myxococcaceae bacterium]